MDEYFIYSKEGVSNHFGHGIQAIRSKQMMKKAKDMGVVFQVCPHSNIRLKAFPSTQVGEDGKPCLNNNVKHPLVALVRNDCKVVLGDDDPSMFDPRPYDPLKPNSPVATSSMMLFEYQYARQIGLTNPELAKIARESFAPFKSVNPQFYKTQISKIDTWEQDRAYEQYE